MKAFPWLMRRELWENRSIYLVPLVFVALLVLIYSWVVLSHGPGGMIQIQVGESVTNLRELAGDARFHLAPFIAPAALLNIVMLFVWFFYLTDSLYAERKDRSVLFWKSLPVNDTSTVLSKLVTAMGVIPAFTFAGILVGAIGMTLANTIFIWTTGGSAWQLVWSQTPLLYGPVILLYALAVQSLWYAPVFGWLLLASAGARRAPALWALLPPAGIALLEGATLHSSRFADLVGQRLAPIVPTAFRREDVEGFHDVFHNGDQQIEWSEAFGALMDPGSFLSDPAMWGGLVVAAVFVAGAIWLRRYRTEF